MAVVVITGPIASGKSTLARALAARLGDAAVVDVDLMYEMLADPDARKDDDALWARARRVTVHLAEALLEEGVKTVIVDGDAPATGLRVALRTSFPSATKRVEADPTRTYSRDLAFLAAHYAEPRTTGDLEVDTDALTVEQAVDAIVSQL